MKHLVWIPPTLGLAAALLVQPKPEPQAISVELYWSTDCPVAARYTPRLADAIPEWREQGITFQFVFPNKGETADKIDAYLNGRGLGDVPYVIDRGAERAHADGIEIVPTVVVSAGGARVYRGPVDDSKNSDRIHDRYLRDALAAALAGESPALEVVEPFGCVLMPSDPIPTVETVNYAEHVAELINNRCVDCHRPDQAAPFSLIGYENASKWAPMIAYVTENRIMPPWPASEYGPDYHGENRLTDAEIQTLRAWADAGAPMGKRDAIPPTPEFTDGWALGEPDRVLKMKAPHELSAQGNDEYWYYVFDPELEETTYVDAFEVRPGNRSIVHHVIAFIDRNGDSQEMLERSGNGNGGYSKFGGPGFIPGGSLGGWAPGLQPSVLPEGAGFRLDPGDRIVLQIHYHKNGLKATDQTEVGLYFSEAKIEDEVRIAWIANPFIRIKPDEANQRFELKFPIPSDVRIYALMPHMHLLGQEMKAWAELPDGEIEELVYVPKWNFAWQFMYALEEPLVLPKGSVIHVEAVYDNSADNPNNPNDPPELVRWGESTTEEMMLLVVAFSVVD